MTGSARWRCRARPDTEQHQDSQEVADQRGGGHQRSSIALSATGAGAQQPSEHLGHDLRLLLILMAPPYPQTAFLSKGSPASGARVVVRAWLDDAFRQRLLDDANAALPQVGLSMGGGLQEQRLKVVENTATQHNVIVCTLCSCYPIALLGPSPTWYKSEGYRSRVVRDPRSVLHDFGYDVPDDVRITVWDASAESRHMVLPRRPAGTDEASEQELLAMVTRNGLIGVAAV